MGSHSGTLMYSVMLSHSGTLMHSATFSPAHLFESRIYSSAASQVLSCRFLVVWLRNVLLRQASLQKGCTTAHLL